MEPVYGDMFKADFTNLSVYDLTDRDYKAVWGSNLDASYLSPSTLNKIPALLSENVKNRAAFQRPGHGMIYLL